MRVCVCVCLRLRKRENEGEIEGEREGDDLAFRNHNQLLLNERCSNTCDTNCKILFYDLGSHKKVCIKKKLFKKLLFCLFQHVETFNIPVSELKPI